ncbi:MAG: ABC transporter permease [Anaerolineales bacterium]|nr:ABC transporter permease [Anaerolineales bacterium]
MSFKNLIKTVVSGVLGNKLRSLLTMLGVVIGVASVITVLALGNGARASVSDAFRSLGADEILISVKQTIEDEGLVPVGENLTYEDGIWLQDTLESVALVQMSVGGYGKIRNGRVSLDRTISGVTAEGLIKEARAAGIQPVNWEAESLPEMEDFMEMGRFFLPAEVRSNAEVCVLGYDTWMDLFLGDDPLGKSIQVKRQHCNVIGVLKEMESIDPEDSYSSAPNESFFLPIGTAIGILFDKPVSVRMSAYVADEKKVLETAEEISESLRERHSVEKDENGEWEDDFNLTTRKELLGAAQESARTLSLLLGALAAVSLVVGGIGIMNVMLVSVTERTREIGVRLAVGAQQRDIILQFLCEAVLLCVAGGIVGIIAGIFTIPLASLLNQAQALLAPGSIPLSFGIATLTGLLFGLYPAVRAAGLDPIEALRFE